MMQKYSLNKDLLDHARDNCLVFHCMPIYRDYEITCEIVNKFINIFLKQAENRLHVQKGIIKWCFD